MKSKLIISSLLIMLSALCCANRSFAQDDWSKIDTTGFYKKTVTTKGKYTLIFISKEPSFDMSVGTRLIDLFFKVYPKEVKEYNHKSATTVTFIIDPTYTNTPAATSGAITKFSPNWFAKHPEDIDCATHELMHIVQAYDFRNYGNNESVMPVWLVEGIADYVRYQFGIENVKSNWTLPAFNTKQSYTMSYRVTARFFAWLEKNKDKHIVKQLDKSLRESTYTADTWTKLTGETVDRLWKDYAANPAVELEYDTNNNHNTK